MSPRNKQEIQRGIRGRNGVTSPEDKVDYIYTFFIVMVRLRHEACLSLNILVIKCCMLDTNPHSSDIFMSLLVPSKRVLFIMGRASLHSLGCVHVSFFLSIFSLQSCRSSSSLLMVICSQSVYFTARVMLPCLIIFSSLEKNIKNVEGVIVIFMFVLVCTPVASFFDKM